MKKKEYYNEQEIVIPSYKKFLIPICCIWFVIQLSLPIRHWFIPGDVLWTEEGHKLSWRMMLRGRSGTTNFYIVDKNDPEAKRQFVAKNTYLSKKQLRLVSTKPDAMWQFAQRLKKEYNAQGKDISVYVHSNVSVNGKKRRKLINDTIDLASVSWNYFTTNSWVIKYSKE